MGMVQAGSAAERVRKLIAESLRTYREDRRMTQLYVAEMMRGVGYRWRNTTVASIEKGERPLYLEEAAALALIFEMPFADLLLPASPPDYTVAIFGK